MTDTTPYLDGHCQTHGKPDHYHTLCPRRFRSQFGTEYRCTCTAHDAEDTD